MAGSDRVILPPATRFIVAVTFCSIRATSLRPKPASARPSPFGASGPVAARMWSAVELMTLRLLLAWHLAPAFLIAGVIGFLEGSWARSNQKGLVKIHSPMRFSLALAGVGLTPAAILLWATTPHMVPVIVLVLFVFTLAVFSIRNLIVHAPTQF